LKKSGNNERSEKSYFKAQANYTPQISGTPLPEFDKNNKIVRNVCFINCTFHPDCGNVLFENCKFIECVGP